MTALTTLKLGRNLEDYRTPNLEQDIEAIESWHEDI
jgi:hypothetical protein